MNPWCNKTLRHSLIISLCLHALFLSLASHFLSRNLVSKVGLGDSSAYVMGSRPAIINVSFAAPAVRSQTVLANVMNARPVPKKTVQLSKKAMRLSEQPVQRLAAEPDTQTASVQSTVNSTDDNLLPQPQRTHFLRASTAGQRAFSFDQQAYYQQMMVMRSKQADEQKLQAIRQQLSQLLQAAISDQTLSDDTGQCELTGEGSPTAQLLHCVPAQLETPLLGKKQVIAELMLAARAHGKVITGFRVDVTSAGTNIVLHE